MLRSIAQMKQIFFMSRSVNCLLSRSSAKVSMTIPKRILNIIITQMNMKDISKITFTK